MSHADSPILMNAAENFADSPARRTSEPSTNANPPPAAAPLTAAITGWGSERRCGINVAMCFCTANPRLGRPEMGGVRAPLRIRRGRAPNRNHDRHR